jgi:hypothetical protein
LATETPTNALESRFALAFAIRFFQQSFFFQFSIPSAKISSSFTRLCGSSRCRVISVHVNFRELLSTQIIGGEEGSCNQVDSAPHDLQ